VIERSQRLAAEADEPIRYRTPGSADREVAGPVGASIACAKAYPFPRGPGRPGRASRPARRGTHRVLGGANQRPLRKGARAGPWPAATPAARLLRSRLGLFDLRRATPWPRAASPALRTLAPRLTVRAIDRRGRPMVRAHRGGATRPTPTVGGDFGDGGAGDPPGFRPVAGRRAVRRKEPAPLATEPHIRPLRRSRSGRTIPQPGPSPSRYLAREGGSGDERTCPLSRDPPRPPPRSARRDRPAARSAAAGRCRRGVPPSR